MTELTRAEQIASLIGPEGAEYPKIYHPDCDYCMQHREMDVRFFPSHYAMSSCRSGGHSHCTCDTCF